MIGLQTSNRLETLDLSMCDIGSQGVNSLCTLLKNHPLKTLDLASNSIQNSDVKVISAALQVGQFSFPIVSFVVCAAT